MRVTVTLLDGREPDLSRGWTSLVDHCREERSDFVLLPEMPFFEWLAFRERRNTTLWQEAVDDHDAWLRRLGELGAGVVAGSRPVSDRGGRFNEAFVWTPKGLSTGHRKTYLPNEPGFWEGNWYDRGPKTFTPQETPEGLLGFLICTEQWFTEHARDYGRVGVTLLLTPRSTEAATADKWLACGRAAAVVAGAFGLSSSHAGNYHGMDFGGTAWVIDPDGNVLGQADEANPFVTIDIDPEEAGRAKSTYPRYVDDSPI